MQFLADNPNANSHRDIARIFGLKGHQRVALKNVLRDMEKEGLLGKTRKSYAVSDILPPVAVLNIIDVTDHGDLIAQPHSWDSGKGDVPQVRLPFQKRTRLTPGVGNKILARIEVIATQKNNRYQGKIIKILSQTSDRILGLYKKGHRSGQLIPLERKQSAFTICVGDTLNAKDGDLVVVKPYGGSNINRSKAKIIEVIGNPQSEKAVSMIALHTHDIEHEFSADALKQADRATAQTLGNRTDWRHLPFITIDPADAKDHDDALYASPDKDKNNPKGYLIYIAIADVAAYVPTGSPLDKEAQKRGNSVYFPDRVVPMLPERISNDLCSLRENEARCAIGLVLKLDKKGHVTDHQFHRVMIKSVAKLSYTQVQDAINGTPDKKTAPLLAPILKPLWAAYGLLKLARDRRQPLDLDIAERKLVLNAEGFVDHIVTPERLDAHKLVEEYMIQANVAAAKTLEKARVPLLYRVHDRPSEQKIDALRKFLTNIKLTMQKDASTSGAFHALLTKAHNTAQQLVVNESVLRAQAQAEYTPFNVGHFGLNLTRYAHFTSPIRRYADLIVHRGLILALGLGKDGLSADQADQLAQIGAHISATERCAMKAERDTNDRLIAYFMATHVGKRFKAHVSGVTKSGLFVRISQNGAEGFIPIRLLGSDYYVYIEDERALIGEQTGETFRLGDSCDVRLAEAQWETGSLRFDMICEGKIIKPVSQRSKRKNTPKPRRGRNGQRRK